MKNLDQVRERMTPERRRKIKARAAEILADRQPVALSGIAKMDTARSPSSGRKRAQAARA